MKYSAFKKEMERKGLTITLTDDGYLYIKNNKATIGRISLRKTGSLSTDFRSFNHFGSGLKNMLLQSFVELSMTPLDEREDEKRYRLRLPFVKNGMGYLNEFQSGDIFVGDKHQAHKHKAIFTDSEIEALKAKHNLDSFVMEMVKDDE